MPGIHLSTDIIQCDPRGFGVLGSLREAGGRGGPAARPLPRSPPPRPPRAGSSCTTPILSLLLSLIHNPPTHPRSLHDPFDPPRPLSPGMIPTPLAQALGCFVMASQAWLSREMFNGSCFYTIVQSERELSARVGSRSGSRPARGGHTAGGGETGAQWTPARVSSSR